MFDWDEGKRQANRAKHGVDFADVARFDWDTAKQRPDDRLDYGETRIKATGLIGHRVHVLVYTPRGMAKRIISLRTANRREILDWLT
jgi:uncharacterized protein